ncbi:MAG: L-lactate permease [Cyanobacteria bacterium P01_C01_bin.89]
MLLLYSLVATLPILSVFLLLVVMRRPAGQVMPIAYLITVAIALIAWRMPIIEIAASSIQGLFATFEILYIVFGAALLLNTLKLSGAITTIRQSLLGVSHDRRIQVIIIAWLFGSFIEGASGFGTPAVITVPLLVAVGFPAMAAVMAALIIQSTPSTFGAVGTPLIIGINNGLEGDLAVQQSLSELGLTQSEYLQVVGQWASLFHGIIGTFLPLILIMVITKGFGDRKSFRDGLALWPFALFSGLALTVPYVLIAWLLGPEFPTLIGGLVGLAIVVTAARKGWLTPKTYWDFPPSEQWPESWRGQADIAPPNLSTYQSMTAFKAWLPYALLGFLLMLSRLTALPIRGWLQSVTLTWSNILGTDANAAIQPLYLPPTIFIVVVILTVFIHRMPLKLLGAATAQTLPVLKNTALALGAAILMARCFINTGVNAAGLDSMPLTLADGMATLAGQTWPIFAPLVGLVGSFVAGSVTVSNLMFSLFQFGVAVKIGVSTAAILGLQCVGASAGNIVCVSNVVAAESTVGLVGREGLLIRRVLLPTLYYVGFAGVLGSVAIYGLTML